MLSDAQWRICTRTAAQCFVLDKLIPSDAIVHMQYAVTCLVSTRFYRDAYDVMGGAVIIDGVSYCLCDCFVE